MDDVALFFFADPVGRCFIKFGCRSGYAFCWAKPIWLNDRGQVSRCLFNFLTQVLLLEMFLSKKCMAQMRS